MSAFLKLHPKDNVCVALRAVSAGTVLDSGVTTASDISMAHKVADRPIRTGAHIIKYGMVIGVATTDIAAGAHVHVHNIASRYTSTHYQEDRVDE